MRITKSDIAKALQSGDITREDLQSVLDGWTPKKRGPKADLIRQAQVLGVVEIMKLRKAKGVVKDVIMGCGNLRSGSSFDGLVSRARRSWLPLPPFDPTVKNGETYQAITLICLAPGFHGRQYTVEIRINSW